MQSEIQQLMHVIFMCSPHFPSPIMIMKLKDISGLGMGVVTGGNSQNSWRFHSDSTVQQENLIAKIHGTFMVFSW